MFPRLRLLFFCFAPVWVAQAHPVLPAFDRMTEKAGDEQLTRAGLLLLAEANCAACHAVPEAWGERLAPRSAPNLSAVGARLNAEALRRFISQPQVRKNGTLMPALLADGPQDSAKIEALAGYLASLQKPLLPMPAGDAERGKELYHRVGCVACHEPAAAAGEKSPGVLRASVPIALAADYPLSALAHFLMAPLEARPGGRMPSLHLTEQEAADLAAYLPSGRPATTAAAPGPGGDFAKGRALFAEQRCANCHSGGEKTPPVPAKALAQLPGDQGCLGSARVSGVPHFDFSETQLRALRLALRAVQSGAASPWSAAEKSEWQMARLNCQACHSRGGQGGPEPARAQYFTANDPGAESLGDLAHLPPNLDRVGRKLTREWLAKILWKEGGSVRPYMNTRMPNFGEAQTAPLIESLEEADRLAKPVTIDTSGLLGYQRAEPGRKLLGATGLGCVSCHGMKGRKSLGPPVVQLTDTVTRLRPEYFKELLLNPPATQQGTLMPPLFAGREAAEKEVETIWTYLREIQGQPLPEGLASDADYELKPAVAGRPIILRSFIEGSGTHAIGVGFVQGLNASFDAKQCRWTLVWRGRFLDALSNFQDRSMPPIKPLGTELKVLPDKPGEREFRGYRLQKNGVPVMRYLEGGEIVEDRLEPDDTGNNLFHFLRRGAGGVETREVLSW